MDSLSNCLTRKLISRGVEKGNLVGLYMDKNIEMFLSILAVHKAGGAYVPLDPDHPAERIKTIIRVSKISIVLTTKELETQLAPTLPEAELNLMVIDFKELDAATRPNVHVNRDDICHVLFTSGSTGTPKGMVVATVCGCWQLIVDFALRLGVILTHGSIIESTLASRDLVGRLNGRILQLSNYTFDLSVWVFPFCYVAV